MDMQHWSLTIPSTQYFRNAARDHGFGHLLLSDIERVVLLQVFKENPFLSKNRTEVEKN